MLVTLISHTNIKEEVEVPEGITLMPPGFEVQSHHRVFRILDPAKGDERLVWDSRNFIDIKAAREMFISLIKKGLKPFRVGLNGQASAEVMQEFDPLAEEVIFLPMAAVVGG
jgi:hypothetical protein